MKNKSTSMDWNQDSRVRLLQELVEINSGTQNFSGVNQVQDRVAIELRKLGFEVKFETQPTSSDEISGISPAGKFLIATFFKDKKKAKTKNRFIDFITHADTVFEPSSGFLHFKLDQNRGIAHGPGVIDDKGGIVIALSGIEKFLNRMNSSGTNDFPSLRFICTPSEETGSPGFIPLLKKLSSESLFILGFEPSLEDGSIISSRRGNWWIDIDVYGKEGHAGRDHAQSLNAAHELAFKLTQLHGLTNYQRDLTISTGQISGGSKFNIVCGHAHAKVDVRFSDFETREEVQNKIKAILDQSWTGKNVLGESTRTTFSVANDCPPLAPTEESRIYSKKYIEILEKIEDGQFNAVRSGGAADVNYMSRPGLLTLDGLGARGGGMHRHDEFILLSSLETRSEALAQFLEFLQKNTKENKSK